MAWLRAGMVVTGLCASGLLALGLVDCAEPTQIVVEVYSDACSESGVKRENETTGIGVGRPENIESALLTTFKEGCGDPVRNNPAMRGVGTLTITPSGDKDEKIAIKVVTGLQKPPTECTARDGYLGCIAHRRLVSFVPNSTQRAVIRLSIKCLNIKCGAGQTCDEGKCTRDEDLLVDGGTVADAVTNEGSLVDGADASTGDACVGCTGRCEPSGCIVDCKDDGGCPPTELCAKDLPCTVSCSVKGQCGVIQCTTSKKCTVLCDGTKDTCGKITCNAAQCDVTCKGDKTCESAGIVLDASTSARLECNGNRSCASATASCSSPDCDLLCNPLAGPERACPPDASAPCTNATGCDDWNRPRLAP